MYLPRTHSKNILEPLGAIVIVESRCSKRLCMSKPYDCTPVAGWNLSIKVEITASCMIRSLIHCCQSRAIQKYIHDSNMIFTPVNNNTTMGLAGWQHAAVLSLQLQANRRCSKLLWGLRLSALCLDMVHAVSCSSIVSSQVLTTCTFPTSFMYHTSYAWTYF